MIWPRITKKLKNLRTEKLAKIATVSVAKLGLFKRLYKIFAFYPGLGTDSAQRRAFYFRMIRDGHGSNRAVRIPALQRDMIARADNFKTKVLQGGKDFCLCRVAGKLTQGMATSVSAIKASLGILNLFKTFAPKVRIWKSSADLVSARASSYVFPSPTTTPSMPNGYPTYPSSSLEMTIFMDRCIFISPSMQIITRGLDVVKNLYKGLLPPHPTRWVWGRNDTENSRCPYLMENQNELAD